MMKFVLLCSAIALSALSAAQVLSVRLGVHSSCPDGLGGCWSGPYEALCDLKDITVSPKCDYSSWMATAKTAGGKLPDMDEIDKVVTGAGQFFTVRGYEVTVKGTLVTRGGQHFLKIPTEKNPVLLTQAVQSHEWDPEAKAERLLTNSEIATYRQLSGISVMKPLVVTGWLRRSRKGSPLAIEVVGVRVARE